VEQTQERLRRLEAELAEAARTSRHAAVIGALQALRGVGLVTAVTLVAELGGPCRDRPADRGAVRGIEPTGGGGLGACPGKAPVGRRTGVPKNRCAIFGVV
jgi:transposase